MNANVLPDVLVAYDNHRKIHPLLYLRGCVFSNLFLPTKKRSKVLWLWTDQNFLHLFLCFCFLFWSGLERRFEYGRISRQCTGSVGVGCPRHIRSPCSLQILTQACCTESMQETSNIFSECLWLSCWNPGESYVVPQPITLLDLVIIWRLISDKLTSDNFINFLWSLSAGWQVLTMWGWRFCIAAFVILIIIKFTMTGNPLPILWFPGKVTSPLGKPEPPTYQFSGHSDLCRIVTLYGCFCTFQGSAGSCFSKFSFKK